MYNVGLFRRSIQFLHWNMTYYQIRYVALDVILAIESIVYILFNDYSIALQCKEEDSYSTTLLDNAFLYDTNDHTVELKLYNISINTMRETSLSRISRISPRRGMNRH